MPDVKWPRFVSLALLPLCSSVLGAAWLLANFYPAYATASGLRAAAMIVVAGLAVWAAAGVVPGALMIFLTLRRTQLLPVLIWLGCTVLVIFITYAGVRDEAKIALAAWCMNEASAAPSASVLADMDRNHYCGCVADSGWRLIYVCDSANCRRPFWVKSAEAAGRLNEVSAMCFAAVKP